jgi:hypothetical protein
MGELSECEILKRAVPIESHGFFNHSIEVYLSFSDLCNLVTCFICSFLRHA